MYTTTAVLALVASALVAATPGRPPSYGNGYGHASTICKTSSWVSTSTYVKPTTVYETTTVLVPTTVTYKIPSTTCDTYYSTSTESKVKYSKTKSVYSVPVTTVVYVTKTTEVEVPYTEYSTCTETYTTDIVTTITTSSVSQCPEVSSTSSS